MTCFVTTNRVPASGNTFSEHPLQNSLVVHKIFQYLETSAELNTLKSIRLVCTLWRDESISWWRKTGTLVLSPDSTTGNHSEQQQQTFTKMLHKLQQPSYEFYNKPFQKYVLQNINFNISLSFRKRTSSHSLWTLVGPQITHLTLSKVQIYKNEKSRVANVSLFFKFLTKHAPNITNLTITDSTFYKPEHSSCSETRSRKLVKHFGIKSLRLKVPFERITLENFPNLEYFYLEKCNANDVACMLRKRNPNLRPRPVGKLKRIEIFCHTDLCSPSIICTSDWFPWLYYPKLEHVSLGMLKCVRSPITPEYFRTLNFNIFDNPKILELCVWPFTCPSELLPYIGGIDTISELRLFGNVVHNLGFLRSTPNLKILHMDLFGIEKRNLLKENAETWLVQDLHYISVDSLTEGVTQKVMATNLIHFQINCAFNSTCLKKLGKWMPNLKTLKTVLISGSVWCISEQWPKLEHLCGLHGSKIEDTDIFSVYIKGLLKLKCLKSFRLDTCCNEGLLTDWVVDSGFLKMRSLVELQLCVSSQFSEAAEKRLKNHVPTTRIIRNYEENEEHKNWECCQIMDYIQFLHANFQKVIKQKHK